jgi:hypothetical protein
MPARTGKGTVRTFTWPDECAGQFNHAISTPTSVLTARQCYLKSDHGQGSTLYPSCFLVLSENSKPPKISSPSRFASYWGIKTPHQRHQRHTVPRCTTCRGCSAAPARRVVPITLSPLRRLSSPLLLRPCGTRGRIKAKRPPLTPILSSPLLSSLPLALPSSCVGSKYQTNLPLAVRPACARGLFFWSLAPRPVPPVRNNPPRRVRLPLPLSPLPSPRDSSRA